MKRAILAAAIATAGLARAQADSLRPLLHAIEVDANAIVDGADSAPLDQLQQLAGDVNDYARQLAPLSPDEPLVKRFEVSLLEATGRLVNDANNQDRDAMASDARDVRDRLSRLRQALAIP